MLFEISDFIDSFSAPANKNADAENFFNPDRKAWHASGRPEPRCDMAPDRFRLNSRGIMFMSLWKRSLYGLTLTEIKQRPEMIQEWAGQLAEFIPRVIGSNLRSGDWAIVTPPPRRHKEHNFAKLVAGRIADILGIPHHPDVAESRTRQRVNVEYTLLNLPPQNNLIIFDDICTTGSTLMSMDRLLRPLGKNLTFIVGINNH